MVSCDQETVACLCPLPSAPSLPSRRATDSTLHFKNLDPLRLLLSDVHLSSAPLLAPDGSCVTRRPAFCWHLHSSSSTLVQPEHSRPLKLWFLPLSCQAPPTRSTTQRQSSLPIPGSSHLHPQRFLHWDSVLCNLAFDWGDPGHRGPLACC
ncbi:hypothetical protein VTI74DRAFT_10258 [Chaetomium olivicolor]